MQRSKSDSGSAVVEFIMLGAPALLLFASGVTMFINSYVDSVARAVALDASRYAALADQNFNSARIYLDDKIANNLSRVTVKSDLQIGQVATVNLEYTPIPTLFSLGTRVIRIKVVTPVEMVR